MFLILKTGITVTYELCLTHLQCIAQGMTQRKSNGVYSLNEANLYTPMLGRCFQKVVLLSVKIASLHMMIYTQASNLDLLEKMKVPFICFSD